MSDLWLDLAERLAPGSGDRALAVAQTRGILRYLLDYRAASGGRDDSAQEGFVIDLGQRRVPFQGVFLRFVDGGERVIADLFLRPSTVGLAVEDEPFVRSVQEVPGRFLPILLFRWLTERRFFGNADLSRVFLSRGPLEPLLRWSDRLPEARPPLLLLHDGQPMGNVAPVTAIERLLSASEPDPTG